jgi:hypothetical protein
MGWGPDMLTVEAKSQDRAKEIASQLGQLGFKAIENEDNAYAGMLDLSKNPGEIQARIASFDISRRRSKWGCRRTLLNQRASVGWLFFGGDHYRRGYPVSRLDVQQADALG